MSHPHEGASLAATYRRVATHLVGRERELTHTLAAVAAGRDLILEGPPGTSKSTLLRGITAEWGIPLFFIEGNADLTPSKLIGHHNPAARCRTAAAGGAGSRPGRSRPHPGRRPPARARRQAAR
jgi:MoxR-like ATPase